MFIYFVYSYIIYLYLCSFIKLKVLTREEKDNSEKRFVNKENDAVNDDMVPEETRSNIFSKRKEVSKSQEQRNLKRKICMSFKK